VVGESIFFSIRVTWMPSRTGILISRLRMFGWSRITASTGPCAVECATDDRDLALCTQYSSDSLAYPPITIGQHASRFGQGVSGHFLPRTGQWNCQG